MTPTNTNGLPKWVRYRAAAYLRGKGLSLGVPSLIDGPLFPILAHEGTAFELKVDPAPHSHVVGDDLSIFADGKFNHVVTTPSHPKLNEVAAKLMVGGHLILISPEDKDLQVKGPWRIKEMVEQDGLHVVVLKRLAGSTNILEAVTPTTGRKRACVARYGAIGDALQLTPMIHQLADDGYEVTLNVSPYTTEVYRNNPYVHNIVVQERNVIPNPDLGEYWDYWRKEYDLYINLSESIEGKLLKVEGRSDFYTPAEWRRKVCDVNYHDQHMKLAGVEGSQYHLPELYFSNSEHKDMRWEWKVLADKFVVMWSLKGSSFHKLYPFYPELIKSWLSKHPDSYVLQMGGPESQQYQITHDRAIPLAGQWPIRKSMLATQYAQLVVGVESAIINAASCYDTPKICLLSHSNANNLTKYWKNVQVLEPNTDIAPCYPCHQLHYKLESCPLVDVDIEGRAINNLPRCTTAIEPERIYDAMETVYRQWRASR